MSDIRISPVDDRIILFLVVSNRPAPTDDEVFRILKSVSDSVWKQAGSFQIIGMRERADMLRIMKVAPTFEQDLVKAIENVDPWTASEVAAAVFCVQLLGDARCVGDVRARAWQKLKDRQSFHCEAVHKTKDVRLLALCQGGHNLAAISEEQLDTIHHQLDLLIGDLAFEAARLKARTGDDNEEVKRLNDDVQYKKEALFVIKQELSRKRGDPVVPETDNNSSMATQPESGSSRNMATISVPPKKWWQFWRK